MKKLTLIISMLALTAMPVSALAVTKPSAAITAAANQTRLDNLHTRGAAEIDRRLTALGKAKGKVSASTQLSTANKQALTTQIDAEITSLTNLKSKLAADTDLTVARADVASIVTEYRVYRLIIPKVAFLTADDHLLAASDKLSDMVGKLNARIASVQSAGKDVSLLQPKLTDMQTQLQAAATTLGAANTAVVALTPDDFNADNKVISAQRDQLKAARQQLQTAAADGKAVLAGLKAL